MVPVELYSVPKDRTSNSSAQLRRKVESCSTEGQRVFQKGRYLSEC